MNYRRLAKPTFSYTILFLCVIILSTNDSYGQGFFKKLFKGNGKKASKEIVKQDIIIDETFIAPTFSLENGYLDCQYEKELADMPKGYERTNLNETEKCENLVEIQEGKFVDAAYLTNFDYFNTWDNWNVNPYNIPSKVLKDSVDLHLYDEESVTTWAFPLDEKKKVTSKYGFRRWRFHHGIDVKLAIGDTIRSMFDGVVRIAKYNRRGYGYYVMVRHKNGLETLYGHMSRYLVRPGQEVKAGEVIGLGGNTGRSTGPHLHFEIRYQGYGFNPEDMIDFANHEITPPSDFTLTAKNYELLIESKKSVYHRIRSGDSLWKISRRYGTSITKICRLNGISKRTTLRVGRTIRVR